MAQKKTLKTDEFLKTRDELAKKGKMPVDIQADEALMGKVKRLNRKQDLVDASGAEIEKIDLLAVNNAISQELKTQCAEGMSTQINNNIINQKAKDLIDVMSRMDKNKQKLVSENLNYTALFSTRVDAVKAPIIDDLIKASMEQRLSTLDNSKEIRDTLKQIVSKNHLEDLVPGVDKINNPEEMLNLVRRANQNDWIKYAEKHGLPPAAAPQIPDKDVIAGLKRTQHELGYAEDVFIDPDIKAFFADSIVSGYQNKIISKDRANALLKNVDNGLYYPIAEDFSRNGEELTKGFRNPLKSVRKGEGLSVENPKQPFDVLMNYARNMAATVETNIRTKDVVSQFSKPVSGIHSDMLNKSNMYVKLARQYNGTEYAAQFERFAKFFDGMAKQYEGIVTDITEKELTKLKLSPNQLLVEYYGKLNPKTKVKDGTKLFAVIPKSMKYFVEGKPISNSEISKVNQTVNSVFTSFISGKFNPFFIPKRVMYQHGEIFPATAEALAFYGKPRLSYGEFVKINAQEIARNIKNGIYEEMARAVESPDWSLWKLAARNRTPDELRANIVKSMNQLDINTPDVVGDILRDDIKYMYVHSKGPMQEAERAIKGSWKWVNDLSAVRFLGIIKDAVDDAGKSTIEALISKANLDKDLEQKIARRIMSRTSDTRRFGARESFLGKALGFVQDQTPYGASVVQGLTGKVSYLEPGKVYLDAKNYIKAAIKANEGFNSGAASDILMRFGTVLSELPENVMVDLIYRTIVLPTFFAYVWNNMNQSQSQYYHSVKNYEKANKLFLANAAGPGVNIAIPLDQEWSVLKNMTEGVLDWIFQLGKNDTGNPAYDTNTQNLLWSIKQDFGISLPALAEAGVNLTGHKTNIDASVPLTEEGMIEPINQFRYKNMNPELAEMLMSLSGKLGKTIVNLVEDRPVIDVRNAIPFMSINPHQDKTSATKRFLSKKLKYDSNNPVLKSWNYKRSKLISDLNFYKKNGTTRNGKMYHEDREDVVKMFEDQINKLDNEIYQQFIS